jgi:hypothetical protein
VDKEELLDVVTGLSGTWIWTQRQTHETGRNLTSN